MNLNASVRRGVWAALAAGLLSAGLPAIAQQNAAEEIARYRAMLQDGNPAELVAMRGEGLWKTKRGPKQVSLEQCDLGLGPGVVKGAYARLPRYFADADTVMDFEARLVHCMVTLQGFTRAEATRNPFSGTGQRQTDNEAITAWVVEQSRGARIDVPNSHPKERAAFDRGKYLFYMRGGPYDFACSTCHGVDGQRIRLQDLPNFEDAKAAQRAFAQWPAYRVSQGALRTMQWRINDCFRQQRFPEPVFVSQTTIDLIHYLGVRASGGTMESPSIKR
ncbi:MAG: sulfur oxidation c-type cytochrome SoxA [Betaproteobacteria bacterium]|jgi:sulfur-oxidizing protein SoxA